MKKEKAQEKGLCKAGTEDPSGFPPSDPPQCASGILPDLHGSAAERG